MTSKIIPALLAQIEGGRIGVSPAREILKLLSAQIAGKSLSRGEKIIICAWAQIAALIYAENAVWQIGMPAAKNALKMASRGLLRLFLRRFTNDNRLFQPRDN